ncbi:hypothetical protein [Streptomyces sp. NPDC005017]|uniref:poly(ethylene terephthalate) hydrolase family protein n=1 Tax=Streptomyces sp. NPDC005017 TaxID=3364706 RepID=UPI0036B116DB
MAGGDQYTGRWYNTVTLAERLLIEVPGDHLCPATGSGDKAKQGKYLVAFFCRWLRGDTRFSPFLCGSERDPDRNDPSVVTAWQDTCSF